MESKVSIIQPVRFQQEIIPSKRVCAYCRVSTNMESQRGSYISQKKYYQDFIKRHPGWELVDVYADYSVTGTCEDKRVEFQRMLTDCNRGKIDIIITKSIQRFARNTVDSIATIRKLQELKVDVYFEKENIHTMSEKSELLLTILSSVVQAESESISTNEKWAIQKKFMDGTYQVGNVAYGYQKDENGEIVVNEDEAKIIRFIFDEYLEGNGAWSIAKKLNQMGVPTKKGKKIWGAHTVRDMLKNQIYTGDLLLQKYYNTELPFKQKRNTGEYPMYLLEENHEPIISKEEFDKVQKLFEYRDKKKSDRSKRYDFTSILICGRCGATFRRHTETLKGGYKRIKWCCKTHIESKDICDLRGIREEVIQEKFVLMWNKLLGNWEEILIPAMTSLQKLKMRDAAKENLEQYDNKISELTEQSRVLNDMFINGYIGSVLFIEKRNKFDTEMQKLEIERKLCLENLDGKEEIKETKYLIDQLKNSTGYMEEYDGKIFKDIVKRIMVNPRNELVFQLKNGLELVERY